MNKPRRPLSAGSWRAQDKHEGREYALDVSEMKENRRPFDYRTQRFTLEIVGRRSQLHIHERLENIPSVPKVRPIVPVFQNISVCFPSGRLLHSSACSVVACPRPSSAPPLSFAASGRAGLPTRGL